MDNWWKEKWGDGFLVKFGDLTEEAKDRYCEYVGSDMDNEEVIACDYIAYMKTEENNNASCHS